MRMKIDTGKRINASGSLSIEAALVLPMFLFMMVCMLSLSALLLFQIKLKESLHEEAKYAAMNSVDKGFPSEGELKDKILEGMGNKIFNIAPIKNGANGIDFSNQGTNDEVLMLQATYQAKLYYDMFGLFDKRFTQSVTVHDWNGYRRGLTEEIGTNEEKYVYVTNDSEVYHIDRNCSHIKLKISAISGANLEAARNSDGGKYKSCEHCHSKKSDANLYITADGDKYHNSLGCSGLKRTVITVRETDVGDKRKCSRCGGK